jgi:hypothetical protein
LSNIGLINRFVNGVTCGDGARAASTVGPHAIYSGPIALLQDVQIPLSDRLKTLLSAGSIPWRIVSIEEQPNGIVCVRRELHVAAGLCDSQVVTAKFEIENAKIIAWKETVGNEPADHSLCRIGVSFDEAEAAGLARNGWN